jgi:hypothetical protein
MEVHAHPHTERKKWTHYFWEFLMLFLAVFCGFLAENQREHMIEHKREKQFISSLLNDLRLDIAWLDTVTHSAIMRMTNIDSGILVLSRLGDNEIPVRIYQHLRRSIIQIMFFPNNGTITQLKSSGGMRLIRNRDAVDSIEGYDRLIRRLEIRRGITNEVTHDFETVLNKVVSGKDLIKTLYDSSFFQGPVRSNQMIKLDDQYLNEFINQSISLRLRTVSDTTANAAVKQTALRLIKFLKTEYSLK